VPKACPPGFSPARHDNGQYKPNPSAASCIKDKQHTSAQGTGQPAASQRNAASGNREAGNTTRNDTATTSSSKLKKKEIEWGPMQLEAIAICHQSTKSGKWECNGALDNQTIVDEHSLESALARQDCSGGTWAAGGPVLKGVQWDAYRCGHAIGGGDYDVAKKYGLVTARRSYICPQNQLGGGRCTTIYDGQDKR
jgi:hypothetical protein